MLIIFYNFRYKRIDKAFDLAQDIHAKDLYMVQFNLPIVFNGVW